MSQSDFNLRQVSYQSQQSIQRKSYEEYQECGQLFDFKDTNLYLSQIQGMKQSNIMTNKFLMSEILSGEKEQGLNEVKKSKFIEINAFFPEESQASESNQLRKSKTVDDSEHLQRILLMQEIKDNITILDLIKMMINQYNNHFEEKKMQYRLLYNLTAYSIRIGKKKNGKANYDLPKFDLDQKLLQLNIDRFCFVYPQEALIVQCQIQVYIICNFIYLVKEQISYFRFIQKLRYFKNYHKSTGNQDIECNYKLQQYQERAAQQQACCKNCNIF